MNRNELAWKCDKDGCFNVKKRLKFAVFKDVFPRNINFTDVDGLVEVGGYFCMLEWKGDGGAVKKAQHRAYVHLTRGVTKNVVFIVYGDAETMAVRAFGYYTGGKYHDAKPRTLKDLRRWLKDWGTWAESEPW